MGCDGGTIPKRDELVRTKRKSEQKDKSAELMAKWQYCALSSNKLVAPIVSCDLGRLYNKDAVIQYLLDRDSTPNAQLAQHIRSLKDIIPLNLTLKSNYSDKKAEIDGQYVDTHDSQYVCPVVGLEMNGKTNDNFLSLIYFCEKISKTFDFFVCFLYLGKYKFCFIRSCGCVMSERALKEVKSENCHKCNKQFSMEDDVIVLNGSDEEIDLLRKRMNDRRNKAKQMKKSKKRKASETETNDDSRSNKLKAEHSLPSTSNSTSNSLTTKTSSSSVLTDKAAKDYSVAKDPNASEVYKSLFTTHKTAQNKPKAHWVTFNPCYY